MALQSYLHLAKFVTVCVRPAN